MKAIHYHALVGASLHFMLGLKTGSNPGERNRLKLLEKFQRSFAAITGNLQRALHSAIYLDCPVWFNVNRVTCTSV